MNYDINLLESYIAVSNLRSFTKAARKVGRTQSAISQQILKLEELLGKNLLDRNNNLSMTNDGELFLLYANKMLSIHKEMIERLGQDDIKGEVRFGLPEDFATLFLTDILSEFVRIHPKIIPHIECDLTLNLLEQFKKRKLDLVLLKMCKSEDFPNGVEVFSEKLVWVGSLNLLSNISRNSPLPLILSPRPCVYRDRAIIALEEQNIKWQLAFSSPSYNSRVAAVKAGLGISILPRMMVPENLTIIYNDILPELSDTHISLLKQDRKNDSIDSFEEFVLKKLRH